LLQNNVELKHARWSLWLDSHNVAPGRIVEFLRETLDRLECIRQGMEELEDDSDEAWRRITVWENRRLPHPFAGRIRRALGRGPFTTFAVAVHEVGTGLFVQYDGSEHEDVVMRGYRSAISLKNGDSSGVQDCFDLQVLRTDTQNLDLTVLRTALQATSEDALDEVRREVRTVFELSKEIGTLVRMLFDSGGPDRLLTDFRAAPPTLQAHLVLAWVAARRSEGGMERYAEAVAAARAIRAKKDVKFENDRFKIVDD
jgi:hypothetical protein